MKFPIFSILLIILLSVTIAKRRPPLLQKTLNMLLETIWLLYQGLPHQDRQALRHHQALR